MEANPFFLIDQPNITIIPALQKHDSRTPDKFMAILWKPGGHSISIKKNMTIGYIRVRIYWKIPNWPAGKYQGIFWSIWR